MDNGIVVYEFEAMCCLKAAVVYQFATVATACFPLLLRHDAKNNVG